MSRKFHVIKYFKLSWNTTALSQSNCTNFSCSIECFLMTSRRPYWCPKTMKRRPCWCPKPILWELNSFLRQTLSSVSINLHRCWPCEWKHYKFWNQILSRRPLIFLFSKDCKKIQKWNFELMHWKMNRGLPIRVLFTWARLTAGWPGFLDEKRSKILGTNSGAKFGKQSKHGETQKF